MIGSQQLGEALGQRKVIDNIGKPQFLLSHSSHSLVLTDNLYSKFDGNFEEVLRLKDERSDSAPKGEEPIDNAEKAIRLMRDDFTKGFKEYAPEAAKVFQRGKSCRSCGVPSIVPKGLLYFSSNS